ncbi:endoplasmic reticulum-Golgi intermediate compartment protein 2-like isoform X1 [Protopterus annectens]|uniref:endoplasmic reticulum-Golgi intermediate compartment protein 2-like isoform X1 n=1 Tax=Protopterus annectens TaxID=7888 RepID=UPI001CFAE9D0|nr:endoplasmic reticulum-Golgi intermediate compartment protein 2-like isoform X1 [Protopterus annectens]
MRRRSRRKSSTTLLRELDAFPKVPESCVEVSAAGGTVSLLAFTLIAVLSIGEFLYLRKTWIKYEYAVDTDMMSKLLINVDITVAMKCNTIGADVVDLAETLVASSDELHYEPVHFELSPEQKLWQRNLQSMHNCLEDEQNLLESFTEYTVADAKHKKPESEVLAVGSHNACRIYGSLKINKVAGNFHITLGRSIALRSAHAHLSYTLSEEEYNFTHRIDHVSFGKYVPGLINPLDGTEKLTKKNLHMYQYFVVVVPTKVNTFQFSIDTHQFSVTEKERTLNGTKADQGIPGIFMKYDMSSLMVKITEERTPIGQFLIRLCGIIGGIFSTAGLLHNFIGFIIDLIFCHPKIEKSNPPTPASKSPRGSAAEGQTNFPELPEAAAHEDESLLQS